MVDLRRVLALVLCVLLLLAPEASSQAPPNPQPFRYQGLKVRTLLRCGATGDKIDVVILGDGYLKSHLGTGGKFEKDVTAFKEHFFNEIPFKHFRDSFNWYSVYVESFDEGAEDGPSRNEKRNAFNSSYHIGGIERLLQFQDSRAVMEAARNAPAIDIIFVIVNDRRYGGSGGTVRDRETGRLIPAPCFSSHGVPSYQVAIHELGHSFANLGDEYVDETVQSSYPLPRGGRDLENPNLTRLEDADELSPAELRQKLKWGHFLDLPGAEGRVGVHEGGFFREKGVWRPSANCKMRTYDEPFCPVCCEAIVRKIHDLTRRPFDDAAYHRRYPIGK